MSQQLRTRDEIGAYFEDTTRTRDLGRGSAFPTLAEGITLVAGDRFFRSDSMIDTAYDGTRWLTRDVFEVRFPLVSGNTATGNNFTNLQSIPYLFIPYIIQFDVYVNTTATNSGTNFWYFDLMANGATQINRVSTATLAASTTNQRCVATNPITNTLTTYLYLNLAPGKIGSPSAIDYYAVARYRYVIT